LFIYHQGTLHSSFDIYFYRLFFRKAAFFEIESFSLKSNPILYIVLNSNPILVMDSKLCFSWVTRPLFTLLFSSFPLYCHSLHQIVFMIDDLGFHDLGFSGSNILTPALDQLHDEGIALSNYHVTPICTSSRSAFLTGRYPFALGLQGSRTIQPLETWGLPLNETTVAQFLEEKYESSHIGKWHIGGSSWSQTPTFRGFTSSFGYLLGAEDYFTHEILGYDMLRSSSKNCGPSCSISDRSVNGTYSAYVFAAEAERVISDYASRRAAGETTKDLFLYLAWQSVHAPVQAPDQYVEPYKHIFQDEIRQVHAGMLAVLDEGIANVTRALAQAGILNESVIITTTDNGGPSGTTCGDCNGALNFPLRGGKHSLYEGGVRGTAFVWSEALFGRYPQGRIYNGLSHITDWLPTMLSWTNTTTPSPLPGFELHGFDLSSYLAATANGTGNTSSSPRDYAILAINPTCNGTAGIVTSDGWKLLIGDPGPPYAWDNATEVSIISNSDFKSSSIGPPGPMATCADGSPTPPVIRLWPLLNETVAGLYFLPSDPREENDLSEQFPQVVLRLRGLLEPWGRSKQIWPSQNATQDKRGDPKIHNGNLIPWLD